MSTRLVAAVAAALALTVIACGKGGAEENSGSPGESAVKTGPGATADTITLGYLPDLSGVFAPNRSRSRTPATTRRRRWPPTASSRAT
jgi:hypothetical protein